MIRVPAQKVHNYRSDRWIALKFFSLDSGGYFTLRSVESVLHADDVRSGHTADTTTVPAQRVHNYRSDQSIALKCFSLVSEGCVTWRSMESVLHADDVLSAKAPTRLEYRLKMSITIDRTVGSLSNFFHEFLEAVFLE